MTEATYAKELYDKLISRGFKLSVESNGGSRKLIVGGGSRLTPDETTAVRQYKPDLIFLALVHAEGIVPEIDQYGIRLAPRMSGSLYIAIANARRETFLAMKRGVAETEEE